NTAQYGGGVYVGSGSFTMEGGKISKNTAKTGGGVANYITFVMSGGEISENTASLSGGGVEATSYGTFTLSGGAKITKNVTGGTITDGKLSGGTANNVCLWSGTVMKVSAALTGSVGVTPKNVDQDIAEGTTGEDGYTLTAADVSCLISEISGKFVCLDSSGKAKLCAVGCFAHLQQLIDGTAAEGTVKLDTDFTALSGEKALNIASGKIITIDLNGHTINRGLSEAVEDGYVIKVNGNLTLADSSTGKTGTITGGYNAGNGGVIVENNGTFTMTGGTISGNKAAEGGGVYVDGTFIMTGGTISDNEASSKGGGVYVDDNGTFYLKNGVTVYGDVDGQGTIKHFGTVTINNTTGGTITASEGTFTVLDDKFYIEGATVTLTATPASFSPVVKDSAGNNVEVTNAENGTFTFIMPDKDVTVEPKKFTVAVTPVDTLGNAVAVQGSWLDSYPYGTSVTLTAPAAEGYNFVGWYAYSTTSPYYTGNALTTNNVYTFTITADTSLAAVYQALGKVSLTIDGGSSFTINGDAKSTSITADYTLGTTITAATNTAKFAYWKNSYGMILSRSASYTFTVTGADTITAVFDTVVENKATLVFESAYGQVMGRNQLATGGTMELPGLPYRNGYTALGWDMNGDGEYNAESDTLAAAITRGLAATNNMVVISPVYELKNVTYTITVTGGTGGGTYNQNDKVTVTANEPGENQKFSHWKDGANNIVSYNASYQFFADRDLEL
ncbi:MAG: InlB B-repeat-containing protein, partial [Clostridia bacterium]|nr:InlB B-repeat-containing protein [Clostridia bacterium]